MTYDSVIYTVLYYVYVTNAFKQSDIKFRLQYDNNQVILYVQCTSQ